MIKISNKVYLNENEVEFTAVRAQGAGGQNVNKVSTAIHLRFDIVNSSLPDFYKQRLLKLRDSRISKEGVLVIKAQNYRSQEKNKEDALQRLYELITQATRMQKKRIPTKVGKAVKSRRLDEKGKRGKVKTLRKKVRDTNY